MRNFMEVKILNIMYVFLLFWDMFHVLITPEDAELPVLPYSIDAAICLHQTSMKILHINKIFTRLEDQSLEKT